MDLYLKSCLPPKEQGITAWDKNAPATFVSIVLEQLKNKNDYCSLLQNPKAYQVPAKLINFIADYVKHHSILNKAEQYSNLAHSLSCDLKEGKFDAIQEAAGIEKKEENKTFLQRLFGW
jgi:hypothetical protein